MKKFLTMLKIESRIALRGIDGVFFGVAMPVGVALLIGMIVGNKPAFAGAEYTFLESTFPALVTVAICTTAFMGIPLGLSDYRDKKILKHYFVTPVRPSMLLLVQVAINLIIALVSGALVCLVMKLFLGYRMNGSKLEFFLYYMLVLVSMYALGMVMASLCRTVKSTNLVCTLVYFPMVFLSGATVPFEILPEGLQKAASVLPLTQGIRLLKAAAMNQEINRVIPIVILLAIALVGAVVSVKTFRWE